MERHQRNVALLVAGTFFMENLDGTIVATAAPSIARDFGVPSSAIGITISAYLLTLAMLIPLSGWVAQRFGARRVFLAAIVVFTVASVLCAISVNVAELTVMRILQGAGGAMMVPVGRLAVLRNIAKTEVIKTIAVLTWPALIAPVLAPLLGGLITTYASWQWIFLVNVPLGIIAFLFALRLIPKLTESRPPGLDWLGLFLTCLGVDSLLSLSDLLAGTRVHWLPVILLAGSAVVLLALAAWHLARTPHPLLGLGVLRIRTFRVAHGGGSAFRLTVNAVPFLLPLMFQDAFGWTPVRAGSFVLFVFVGNLAIKPGTTVLLARFAFRTVLLGSTGCAAASMVLTGLLTASTPTMVIVIVLIFGGMARSVGFTGYNTIAYADIDQPMMAQANTLSATMQQIAVGFGVAVGAVLLRLGYPVADLLGHGESATMPYRFAFFAIAALTMIAVIEAFRLDVRAGDALRSR